MPRALPGRFYWADRIIEDCMMGGPTDEQLICCLRHGTGGSRSTPIPLPPIQAFIWNSIQHAASRWHDNASPCLVTLYQVDKQMTAETSEGCRRMDADACGHLVRRCLPDYVQIVNADKSSLHQTGRVCRQPGHCRTRRAQIQRLPTW